MCKAKALNEMSCYKPTEGSKARVGLRSFRFGYESGVQGSRFRVWGSDFRILV